MSKTSSNKRYRKALWKELRGDSEIGECWICKKELKKSEATLDHIIEKALGGSNHKTNLALAHAVCNESRSAGLSYQLSKGLVARKKHIHQRKSPLTHMFESFAQNFAPDFEHFTQYPILAQQAKLF